MSIVKKPHPHKGKTREQITEMALQRRVEERRYQYETDEERAARTEAKNKKDKEDELAIFSLLFSYTPENPYSYKKFSEDFAELCKKQDATT